jgi:deazaflavin-dependent oxidoreductase (nitroreductase family)
VAGGVVVLLATVATAYALDSLVRVVLWRSHWQPGLDALARYNKRFANASAVRKAGKQGTGTTAVHHVGRKSGKPYVTPVWGERVRERFFIQLPYGTDVDWCSNVLAAGGCTLEQDGVQYDAVAPVIVPAVEARPHLRPAARRMQGIIGAEHYLQLDIRPADTAGEDLPNPTRVAAGVFKVPGMWVSNVYLVETDGGGLLLVDTGPGQTRRILRFIEAIGRQPSELRDIVLTHFDADHVGSGAALKARTGAHVSIHALDAAVIAKKEPPRKRMLLVVILYKLLSRAVTADQFLSDGDTIGGLRVVHVPGHTQGSIALVRDDGVLFSGDALITDEDGALLSTDVLPAEDPDLAIQSAERIKALNPRIILPGHGAPWTAA